MKMRIHSSSTRWGETSLTLFTTWERGLGHLTWVTFWNFKGIWSKTPPLIIHKNKSLLSFPLGRPQDFRLEISQYVVHQCWTFWLASRFSQTLHPDNSSELKQIHYICWEQGWRVSWWSISVLGTQEPWTISACTFALHTIFTLRRTRQLMRTRGQPHGWLVQPQMELDWPLGSLCSHLWNFKITNAFLKNLLLTEENRTQNSCKEWDKASKSVFDLKTTGDFLGNYSSKLPFMGRQGEQKSNGLPTGKGVHQGCILSPCLFNLYAEYIMRNAGLDEAQAGIKIAGRNINNLIYADDTTLMAESKEELKSLLRKLKWGEWKVGLNSIKRRPWHLVPSLHGS